jgi:hypothetical protein
MKSKLEKLTSKEIEAITKKTMKNKSVPLVVSRPTQISLNMELTAKVEVLSSAQGVPAEKFVNELLKDDLDRLWKKFKKAV